MTDAPKTTNQSDAEFAQVRLRHLEAAVVRHGAACEEIERLREALRPYLLRDAKPVWWETNGP